MAFLAVRILTKFLKLRRHLENSHPQCVAIVVRTPPALCYKINGKRHSCAYIELWMHLGGLLSTQDARVDGQEQLLRFFRA